MAAPKLNFSDLEPIRARIHEARAEYVRFGMREEHQLLLHTFSDLAQEYESLEDFYRLCTILPQVYLGQETRLYLPDEGGSALELVCDSRQGLVFNRHPAPVSMAAAAEPCDLGSSRMFPIRRKSLRSREGMEPPGSTPLLGALDLSPSSRLSDSDHLFLDRYTYLIGYHLHNRVLTTQSLRHLRFVNSLVMDIEHNVIVPNMYFKHIFNQLTKKIRDLRHLQAAIRTMKESSGLAGDACQAVVDQIAGLHRDLMQYDEELRKHHAATSLFIESLFRRDHFEKGQFVLRPRMCFVEKEIILPQLDQYRSRFQRRRIRIEQPTDMLEEEIPLLVDVGLLAQVYANLFSNAVKYTEQIIDHRGLPRKAVTYGREIIRGCFGPGKDAIKLNVFTTGRHLSAQEAESIFHDGYRRKESQRLPGTGHGLSFLKQVIEVHGGIVGYEATEEGNNFYFLLPLPAVENMLP